MLRNTVCGYGGIEKHLEGVQKVYDMTSAPNKLSGTDRISFHFEKFESPFASVVRWNNEC